MVGPRPSTRSGTSSHLRQLDALELIPEIAAEFARRPSAATSGGLLHSYRTDDAETIVVALGSVLGTIKDAVDARREHGERVGVVGITSFRPFPIDDGAQRRSSDADAGSWSSRRRSASASGACSRPTWRWRPTTPRSRCTPSWPVSVVEPSPTARSKPARQTPHGNDLAPLTFLDLDLEIVERERARIGSVRRSGPSAENVLS